MGDMLPFVQLGQMGQRGQLMIAPVGMSPLPADAVSPATAGREVGVDGQTIMRWARHGHIRYWRFPSGYHRVSLAEVRACVLQGIRCETGLEAPRRGPGPAPGRAG